MLVYDGRAMEDVAPVNLIDVQIGPIKRQITARDRALRSGADFVRIRGQTRAIAITYALRESDADVRAGWQQAVLTWAIRQGPRKLLLPDRQARYIEAICTAPPEYLTREWWKPCKMVFTAYDPYFVDTDERYAACGTGFMVNGSAEPKMRIRAELDAAISDPVWTRNGNESIRLRGSVGPGALEIDLNAQTITLNGYSLMRQYRFDSTFFSPALGCNVIDGPGRVYWRERWE